MSGLDFNQAADQRKPLSSAERTAETERVREALLSRLKDILFYLFPAGKTQGKKFYIGDVRGNAGDSLQVELEGSKTGMWHDFATGEGGDIFSLWAAARNIDSKSEFPRLMQDIGSWLGDPVIVPHRERVSAIPDDLGHHTGKWDYRDKDGKLIACVYRYDTADRKQFRPWDVLRRSMKAPTPRPLYRIPEVIAADTVVLVEGEKCVDALASIGICATTAMNGANAPVDKTDWSPLAGKHIIIWPDQDEAGKIYAAHVIPVLIGVAASVRMITPDAAWPEKYDAADAVRDGLNVTSLLEVAQAIEAPAAKTYKHAPKLTDWKADRYAGQPPEQKFLVEGVFPLQVVSILAGMGDTGKGMLTLNLALQVATSEPSSVSNSPFPESFGGRVLAYGQAVIFTAEDDQEEVHRRLSRLDPEQVYLRYSERLMVVPLPNACGPLPLVTVGQDGPMAAPAFQEIREQLLMLPDLRLVVFDPFASFIHADITSDPAAGSFATGLLAALATETRAAIIVAHHMRKPQGGKPIATAQQARDAIRGTSALVDGVRAAYALWPVPPEDQPILFRAINERPQPNALFQGAVVKANGPADRAVRTYWRGGNGLLLDVTGKIKDEKVPKKDLLAEFKAALARSALAGHPFCHTGGSGVFRQRHRLPAVFRGIARHRLEEMVQELLDTQILIKGRARGSTEEKWLDVPNGPFAKGEGILEVGAEDIYEN